MKKINFLVFVFLAAFIQVGCQSVKELKKETPIISMQEKEIFSLKFNNDYLENIPKSEIYLGEKKVADIDSATLLLEECEEGKEYSLKTKIGDFKYESTPKVSCNNKTIVLGNEASYMLGVLDFAKDYVNAIEYDNEQYREEALEIIKDCKSGDIECYTDKILKHFSSTIKYVGDRRDQEHIEGVKKTLETGIGDCEDISIVLSTYLENIGIKTKFVIISGHAYSMACGLSTEKVESLVPEGKLFNYYPIADEYCFALEGTLGEEAYIGFDAGEGAEKLVIDPVTKEYSLIDSGGFYESKSVILKEIPIYTEDIHLSDEKEAESIKDFVGEKGMHIGEKSLSPDGNKIIFYKSLCEPDSNKASCAGVIYVYDLSKEKVVFQFDELHAYFSNYDFVSWVDNNKLKIRSSEGTLVYDFSSGEFSNLHKKLYKKYYPERPENFTSVISDNGRYAFVRYQKESTLGKYAKSPKVDYHNIVVDTDLDKELLNIKEEYQDQYSGQYQTIVFSKDSKRIALLGTKDEKKVVNVYDIPTQQMFFLGERNSNFEYSKFYSAWKLPEWSPQNNMLITYPYGEIFDVAHKKKYSEIKSNAKFKIDRRKKMNRKEDLVLMYTKVPLNYIYPELKIEGAISVLILRNLDGDNLFHAFREVADSENALELDSSFSWHPTEDKFVYTRDGGVYLAEVMKKDDNHKVIRYRLDIERGHYSNVVWDNDGNRILLTKKDKIYSLTFDNKNSLSQDDISKSISNQKNNFRIEKILKKYEDIDAEKKKADFYSKYNVLHKGEGWFSKELFINDKKISDEDNYNVFAYGTEGNYYSMKDNTKDDLVCDGKKIPRVTEDGEGSTFFSTNTKNNIWCIYYKGEEYNSNGQPYLVTDDFVVYSRCEKTKYLEIKDRNACVEQGLYLNRKKIDLMGNRLNYQGKELMTGTFQLFSTDGRKIAYNKHLDGYYVYDTASDSLNPIISPIALDDNSKFEDAKIEDNRIGVVVKKGVDFKTYYDKYTGYSTYPTGYKYNLYFNNRLYENISAFNILGEDIYYLKTEFVRKDDYDEIYKASLIKNEKKIAGFYMKYNNYLSGTDEAWYDSSLIEKHPFCLPKHDICLYDENHAIIKAQEYKPNMEKDKWWMLKPIYKLNNEKIYTQIDRPFWVTPVIEDAQTKYLIVSGISSSNLINYTRKDEPEIELYIGDVPMCITKKE